jgi:hypothetical protein
MLVRRKVLQKIKISPVELANMEAIGTSNKALGVSLLLAVPVWVPVKNSPLNSVNPFCCGISVEDQHHNIFLEIPYHICQKNQPSFCCYPLHQLYCIYILYSAKAAI